MEAVASAPGAASQDRAPLLAVTAAAARGLVTLVLLPPNRPHDVVEADVVVDLLLGGRLVERRVPALRQLLALLLRNFSLVLEVALVARDDNGDVVLVFGLLRAQDLLTELLHAIEGVLARDIVDQQEAVALPDPLVLHSSELLLPC